MQADMDLAKQIVQLLQDIIIKGAEVIYEKQRESAQRRKVAYPYSGPIMVFDRITGTLTVSQMGMKSLMDAKAWATPDLSKISESLKQFSKWQGKLSEDQGNNLSLIRKYLRRRALQVLDQVSGLYGFRIPDQIPDAYVWISASPTTTNLFSDKSKDNDELMLMDELEAPEFEALVDEFNWALARLIRLANQPKVAPVIVPVPVPLHSTASKGEGRTARDWGAEAIAEHAARKNKDLSEKQPKPASLVPAQEPESAPATLTTQWYELGKLRIRADFLEVQRRKQKWTLTQNQGKALEFVYKCHRANNSIHQRQVLHHIESPSVRLRETFRSRNGLYAALFAKGEGKGHIRLNT